MDINRAIGRIGGGEKRIEKQEEALLLSVEIKEYNKRKTKPMEVRNRN